MADVSRRRALGVIGAGTGLASAPVWAQALIDLHLPGGNGARTMMLVYDLPSVEGIYGRFGGVTGSAYLVGGVGMTLLTRDDIMIVPVKTGIGARLGVNLGYLKITPMPTWNPF